ncbi:MAG: glucosidase [Thermodesulfobacteriota bacterium]
MTREEERLEESRARKAHWRRWGPYLSERQWGTVREDYSPNGTPWDYFSHDQARARAYRWGEDGIAGISDNHQRLCFAIALWNEEDPILKERLFGLTNTEGNHGEDAKEYYFYLDNTPTHSYMNYLYKYPQKAFPYSKLVDESRLRGRAGHEYELLDTGVFEGIGYFDVFVEYAKNSPEDILVQISVVNRGFRHANLHLLPTIWFRNAWSWDGSVDKPELKLVKFNRQSGSIEATHSSLGKRWLHFENSDEVLFTENETNYEQLYGVNNSSAYVKDGINEYMVHGDNDAVNPENRGTKASVHYRLKIGRSETKSVRLRLADSDNLAAPFGYNFDRTFDARKREANDFYKSVCPFPLTEDMRNVQRQAFAGLLWNKQFYHYVVEDWLRGDPSGPAPPRERKRGRNHTWVHLYNDDILSMPDKWEYPWFAAWDLAFHAIPLALIDPDFAKRQLMLLTREWYMHPNGQIPACEWSFDDVNPPVHAWAAWRVYQIDQKINGRSDIGFLERVFQKLLLNFTWWVNRKDSQGKNVFEGGFLGLDNVGIFDRSSPLPTGGYLEQADGTSWMGMYCLNMLTIALELAKHNSSYEDIASKFFEHFIYIADAMNKIGGMENGLWDEDDGFYYDVLKLPDGSSLPIRVQSVVGLIPLFAVMTIESDVLDALPNFERRLRWFIENRTDLLRGCACIRRKGIADRSLLAIVDQSKLKRIMKHMLDEAGLLGPYGIRSVSKFHEKQPYVFEVNGNEYRLDYEPAESMTSLFGGNSNWRGPVWFPVNYLIIESLQKFHYYFGDDLTVGCPTRSGNDSTLWDVATELSFRLIKIFLKNSEGNRPVFGETDKFQTDPYWKDYVFFYEYFHGDNGTGLGASHQTGWTGLVAKLIEQYGGYELQNKGPELIERKKVKYLARRR